MKLTERFISGIKENNLFSTKDKLLLAVSGGIDSIVLCELCKQAGFDFAIVHCNFQLRGEESKRDEEFVRGLGKKYTVEVIVKKFETEKYAREKRISIQEAARELRYEWFFELTRNTQYAIDNQLNQNSDDGYPLPIAHCFLLTAHHADDNIETIVMNFFRGTGLHGLTGMPVKGLSGMDYIRRPLLDFSREEIVQFAKENNLQFVEDSSNQSIKYTRNFFRHEIIPAISKVYPQVKENLRDNIERFKEIESLYQFSVGEIKRKLCKQKNNEVHIPVKQLMDFNNRALVYEIISGYGFTEKQVEEVYKLAESGSGRFIQSPGNTFRMIKHRHWFIISPVVALEAENIIIEEGTSDLQFATGKLELSMIDIANCRLPVDNLKACLDAKEITFPLLLRKWKQGDYFYPLGMKKKKKLSRFFIDQKLSKADKEKVWVIEMNKKIIWVVGHRIDDRFRLIPSTKKVLKITCAAR